jgi:hypothetical protein
MNLLKLFSINKKESLVEILQRYTEEEIRKAIPEAFPGRHYSLNPPKTKPPKEKKIRKSYIKAGMFI